MTTGDARAVRSREIASAAPTDPFHIPDLHGRVCGDVSRIVGCLDASRAELRRRHRTVLVPARRWSRDSPQRKHPGVQLLKLAVDGGQWSSLLPSEPPRIQITLAHTDSARMPPRFHSDGIFRLQDGDLITILKSLWFWYNLSKEIGCSECGHTRNTSRMRGGGKHAGPQSS